MKKKFVKTLCVAMGMMMCFCSGAYAAGNVQAISAFINRDITIKLDGVTQTMKDAKGSRVYPIIYNGTTYVPLRAVSNILGVDVTWDGATQTVLLGDPGATSVAPYEVKNGTIFDGSSAKSFTVTGKSHAVGFTLRGRSISSESYAMVNTSGKDTLSFDVGHVDGTGDALLDLGIFLDGKYEKTVNVKASQGVKHIEVDLDGASVVKLQFVGEAGYFSGEYGFYNLAVE